MHGTLSHNRRHGGDTGGGVGGGGGGGGHHHCRYYATERRRHRRSSFSIMRWFRRKKRYGDGDDDDDDYDDDDDAWFRDDLNRIQQAYVNHEADYAAVTPIALRRRPAGAATWSKWSGSTTTVYSFAYVNVAEGRDDRGESADDGGRRRRGYGDDDVVEYIDAATLPVTRRRSDRGQRESQKPSATTSNRRATTTDTMTGTMTGTRRRTKRIAPPPPPPRTVTAAGPSSVEAAKTSTPRRRTGTTSRKKYRAPQPPVDSRPPQQHHATGRRGTVSRRHKKGQAPKPPVVQQRQQEPQPQQPQQQQPQQQIAARPTADETEIFADSARRGSNVKRKISQYERDRLMERVDKIEKHFLFGDRGATARGRGEKTEPKAAEASPRCGEFASVAELYKAMAVTNLTELDRRAAEICRRNRLAREAAAASVPMPPGPSTASVGAPVSDVTSTGIPVPPLPVATLARIPVPPRPAATSVGIPIPPRPTTASDSVPVPPRPTAASAGIPVPPRPAVITTDCKNAIVAAVIRKSYPTAVAGAPDGHRPGPSSSAVTAVATDDEKILVRHKRMEFLQGRATESNGRRVADAAANKSTLGTQTTGCVVAARGPPKSRDATAGGRDDTASGRDATASGSGDARSSDSKTLPSEDNNCYQQLMAMEMQSDLVLHDGPFECPVCLCAYDNDGVVLRDCLHVFCRPCLKMTIGHSKAEQVECPYMDEMYSCTGVLQHREIKKILDSDEEYERFLQRSVERARQLLAKDRNGGSFQCRRPDCTGWCLIYDKNEVVEFKCPVCGTVTCVRCGSIHRQGKGCKIFKEVNDNGGGGTIDTLENLIERGDAMPCPGCNTILSKQQGCDWIKCAVCFMEICWATKGPRWGPKGKGDTTAGCMCGIPPGRKCHTDCKYCH